MRQHNSDSASEAQSAFQAVAVLGFLFVLAGGVGPVLGAEPTPTPTPTATPTATATPTPAEVAAGDSSITLGQAAKRTPKSPAEDAASSGERKPTPAPLVITNSNLKEVGEEGRLTMPNRLTSDDYQLRSPRREEGVFAKEHQRVTGEQNPSGDRREYWRTEYRNQLQKIDGLERQVDRLTEDINRLQNQFYATDDPAYRDGVVKVRWDQAIADRDKAREDLAAARDRLPTLVAEARSEGAEPGWFRGLEPDTSSEEP